ncbi:MAG: hypothetical protein HDR14_11685 [Lachnospiraceae bacterium]|nr:hypothetical protein [Lachnospiraceae bacterium]
MMKELLQWLFVLQLQVSIMVMVILALRIILKKAPRIYSYLLWLIVFVRLLCPVTLESPVSIIPAREQIMEAGAETMPDFPLLADNQQVSENPQALAGGEKPQQTPAVSDWQVLSEHITNLPEPEQPIQKKWDAETVFFTVAGIVWLGVAAALMLYNIITLKRLKKRLLSAVKQEDGYFISTAIETPFVLGFFSPKIYLPEGIQGRELSYILEHEKTHLWRKDYVIKPACLFLTCIYWFNPLVWAAFLLMGKDMEMSCDEHVLGRLGEDIKADYSESLLQFASGRKYIAVPLAFGENGVKARIRNVLRFKKAKIWISVVAVLLCVAAGAVLLTTRQNKEPDLQTTEPNGMGESDGTEGGEPEGFGKMPEQPSGEENTEFPVPTARVEGDLFTAVNEWAGNYAVGEADILYEPYQFYLAEPSNQVLIYYEKWTDAPELTILIEVLSYTETEEGYQLEHEGFKLCDSITSKEEFEEAYCPLSEQNQYLFVSTFSEIIAERMALGDKSVDDFKTPQKAAERALHLGAGHGEIRFVNEEETIAVYRYTFDKDGSQIDIPLHMEEFSYPIWTVGDVEASEDFAKQQRTASMEYAGESYCFYLTGFYKVLEDGTLKCLYPGYVRIPSWGPAFLNGFAYFEIDLLHTPYSLDYANNAVVEVNLETEEWRLAYVDENCLRAAASSAESGMDTLQLQAVMEYETNLAYLKAVEAEMEERASFSAEISLISIDRIPLKSQDEYGCSASFDLDLDGKADEIKLTTISPGSDLLMINDASVEIHPANLFYFFYKLQMIRPDGEELLLLLYDDGPSSDPMTTFYRYRGGTIKIIGSIPCDVWISDTGEMKGSYRFDAIQTEWAEVTWVYTGEGFEMKEQPYYDYSGDVDLTLLVELPVHSEMSLESEAVTLAPQKVKLLHTDMEHWFYAEGENGVGGWFYVEKKYGMVPEAGVNVDSVFDGLLYVD